MTLDQMLYLIKIAETHSITAASNKLFITQQALSFSIKALEEELGVLLLERRPKGAVLTEDGQRVLKTAYQMIQLRDELCAYYCSKKPKALSGTLHIITNPGVDLLFLPKIISYFYKHYPDVILDIMHGTAKHIETAVAQRQADIGLVTVLEFGGKIVRQFEAPLKFVPYYIGKFVYCVHRDSPLSKYKTISLRSIAKNPLIIMPNDDVDEYLPLQVVRHFGDPEIFWSKSSWLSRQMLLDNLGGLMTPIEFGMALAEQYPDICTIKIKDKFAVHNGFLFNEDLPASDLLQAFCSAVQLLKDDALTEFISYR